MPFSFRRTINYGGVRTTFSKSGVSTSVGGKGYRLTSGPRGTYITLGAEGIHYRQRIGGYMNQPQPVGSPPQNPERPQQTFQTGTPIRTAEVSDLIELSSAATLEQLNKISKEPAYAWLAVLTGGVIGLILATIHWSILFLVIGLSLYIASIINKFDTERRTFHLEYQLDTFASQRWNILTQSINTLAGAEKVWRVTTQDSTYDWKRNAGASTLINRTLISIRQRNSGAIISNIVPFCFNIGEQEYFFLPDRVYIRQNSQYGAVEYSSLNIAKGETRFIEDQGVPRDSQVVAQTWRFVNKGGGPDQRFNNNYQMPIVQYGVLEITSVTGINLLFQVSSVPVAQQFVELFQKYQNAIQSSTNPQQERANPQTTRPNPWSTTPPSSLPACYHVLGLSINCTKEEAAEKYRQLAMSYHPDRVSHLATEFKELAAKKMTEINLAAQELRRLKGWQ